jgi:hypothetical protein
MENPATRNGRRTYLADTILKDAGWLFENGFNVPAQPQRFTAVERSSGDIIWAYEADTLQSLAKNIEESETAGVDQVDVYDLDRPGVQFIPERKIVAFFRSDERVEVAESQRLPARQVALDFVSRVEAILTRSPYYPADYRQRAEEIAALSKHVSVAPQLADPWQEHPDYPMADWRAEVSNGDTVRGYQDWVKAKLDE